MHQRVQVNWNERMESELEEKGEKIKKDFLVTQNSIDRLQGMSTEKKSFGDQFS